jgi:DNA-binding MarR family transcriptional regulator
MSGAYDMTDRKIHGKLANGQEILLDLDELLFEKFGENPVFDDSEFVKTFSRVHKRHFRKGEFFMQSFAFDNLIMEKRYNMVDLKLIIALRRRLDFNNRIQTFRQYEFAEELESSQANISRALKKLIDDGIVYKDGHDFFFSDKYIKGAGDRK